MNSLQRASLAEFIGTFTLVFIGAGAGALAGPAQGGIGLLGVALAHGIALLTIVYAWGAISGANVNPAVTLGLLIAGKIDVIRAVFYWVAQLSGGIVAAYTLQWLFKGLVPVIEGLGETKGALTSVDPLKTIVVEGILTFFLVTAVFGSAVAGRGGNAVGLAIGLILTMDILMGGHLTGASMNPARTLGPAVAMGDTSYVWMYFVGPLAGGGIAALLYNILFIEKKN